MAFLISRVNQLIEHDLRVSVMASGIILKVCFADKLILALGLEE